MNTSDPSTLGFTLVSQHLVMAEHLNPNYHLFGGQLLAWLDKDIYIHLTNELRYKTFVTLNMDDVHFKKPGNLGDIIRIYAKIDKIRKTSVTACGKAVTFNVDNASFNEIIDCHITYVALNEAGRPVRIKERNDYQKN